MTSDPSDLPRRWPALDLRVGALVFRPDRWGWKILLSRRRDEAVWSVPKGHIMPSRSPSAAACVEATEEAGIICRSEPGVIGSYIHKKRPGGLMLAEPVEVVLFRCIYERSLQRWPEQEFRERHWARRDECPSLIGSRALAQLVANQFYVLQQPLLSAG